MELASRIISILLGVAVMIFVLWPVTIPVGFGEVWWASRQVQSRPEPPAAQPASQPQVNRPSPPLQTGVSLPRPQAAAPATSEHAVLPGATEGKSGQSAPETAGQEQIAAVEERDTTATIAPGATSKTYRRVTVRDGGSLQSGGVVIRLAGIVAREANATCKDERGKTWPCGHAAKAALTRLIRARAVTCVLPKSGEHNIFDAHCSVGGTDLSIWMVRQGWAEPRDAKEPALAEAARAAQSEKIGLWRARE